MDNHAYYDRIIIGGGLSGIVTAYILTTYGFKVLLLENGFKLGSFSTSFSVGDDYIFDYGYHTLDYNRSEFTTNFFSKILDKKFHKTKAFYIVIAISLILGLLMNGLGISPVKALIYSAILYGLTAPVLIAIILHIANNKKVMGNYTNGKLSNILGFATLILMTAAAVIMLYLQFAL